MQGVRLATYLTVLDVALTPPGGFIHRGLVPFATSGTLKSRSHPASELSLSRPYNGATRFGSLGGSMISRRRFLEAGGITTGLAFSAHSRLMAKGAECPGENLPPSIAALKSRKNEAQPITRDERSGRWDRARQLMTENSLDAILLMEGTSLKYFAGIRWWGGRAHLRVGTSTKGIAILCVSRIRGGPRSRTDRQCS